MIPIRRRLYQSLAGFTPRQLFAALQGAWLEPTPGSIWQENTGVTPTTTGGQTIGLMLDQSQGAVLGPELLSNTNFSTDTYWSKGTGWTISGGAANATASPNSAGLSRAGIVTGGKYYRVTFTILNYSSGGVALSSGSSGYTGITRSANGTYTEVIYVTTTALGNFNIATVGASTTLSIDNVSCMEILGNHAAQSTAANRPTYQLDSNNLPLARHDTTDSLSVSLPSINVRRNLLTYSERFDNAQWVFAAGLSATLNTVAPPSVARQTVTCSPTGSGSVLRTSNVQIPTSGPIVFSIYAKAGTCEHIRFDFYNSTTTTGISGSGNIKISDGIPAGDGWYRHYFSINTGYSSGNNLWFYVVQNNADGSRAIGKIAYLSAGQVEAGTIPTDYQKITDWTSEAYASSGSVYFATPVGMSALHNQSMGTTYTLPALSTDIYSWIVVPQRLSTAQESRLSRYMDRKAGIAGPDYFEQVDYGPELVTNGDFSNGTTGWTTNDATLAVVNNRLEVTTIVDYGRAIQGISVVAGKTYIATCSITNVSGNTANSLQISSLATGGGVPLAFSAGSGSRTATLYYLAASTTTVYVCAQNNSDQPSVNSFDNISVRELKDGMTGQLFADDGTELLLRA